MYSAHTTQGTFEAESWDALVTKIGDWQGERTDYLRRAVELTSAEDLGGVSVSDELIRSANKDLQVWFSDDCEANNDYSARSEHSTWWNNDGRA